MVRHWSEDEWTMRPPATPAYRANASGTINRVA